MVKHNFFIYSNIGFSKKSAAATRMLYYARAIASKECTVYLTGCCTKNILDSNFIEQEPNVFILRENSMLLSFWGTFSFLRRLSTFSKEKKGKNIFLLYPSAIIYTDLLTLLYFKLYNKFTVFYELNEVRKYSSSYQSPMSFKRIGYSFKKLIFKSIFTISQPLLSFYDGLICISTNIDRYGKKFNRNTLRIPILTDVGAETKTSNKTYFTKKAFNIGFSGSIHPIKENLDDFIDIIKKLTEHGYTVSFNLCGSIFKTYKTSFLELCEISEELNYYGFLDDLEMSTFLSQQDLLVVPRGYTLQNKYGFSTKLSDYLNHSKPVLVTDVSDNSLYIKDGENGFIVAPDDSELMYQKLVYIIDNFKHLKKTVEPNAFKTANGPFNYVNYKNALKDFLTAKK